MTSKARKKRADNEIAALKKRIEKETQIIAARRDALRELLDQYSDIAETCDDAIDSLEYAAEQLSRFL